MAWSPALPASGGTEEVTRKREVRLMKNRWETLTAHHTLYNTPFSLSPLKGLKGERRTRKMTLPSRDGRRAIGAERVDLYW